MRLSSPKITSPNFFGFAQHGNFESKSTVTYLDVPDDDGPCYYFFNNFILNSGHTLTTIRPCRGLYIYVLDTAIINGTITMTDRGIYSPLTGEYKNGFIPLGLHDVIGIDFKADLGLTTALAGSGINGSNGGCGGGSTYRYTRYGYDVTAVGGSAGLFSGGSGCGPAYCTSPCSGYHYYCYASSNKAQDYGGAGGGGEQSSCGCVNGTRYFGCGNPGYRWVYSSTDGWQKLTYADSTGTGGILYIIANQLISTTSTGKLTSEGHTCSLTPCNNNGGGRLSRPMPSGGGGITIIYKQSENISSISTSVVGKSATNDALGTTVTSPKGSVRIKQIL